MAAAALLAELDGADVLPDLHRNVGPRSATAQAVTQARTDARVLEAAQSRGTDDAVDEAAPIIEEACAGASFPEPTAEPTTTCGEDVLAALEQTTFPIAGTDGGYSAYLSQWGSQSERGQALISLAGDQDLIEDFMTSGLPGFLRSASLQVDALCESYTGPSADVAELPD